MAPVFYTERIENNDNIQCVGDDRCSGKEVRTISGVLAVFKGVFRKAFIVKGMTSE